MYNQVSILHSDIVEIWLLLSCKLFEEFGTRDILEEKDEGWECNSWFWDLEMQYGIQIFV